MKMKLVPCLIFSVATLLIYSVTMLGVCLASPANWSEVTRFIGSGTEQYTTDYFTCDHVEWRIRWEYVPYSANPNMTLFNIFIYPQEENTSFIGFVNQHGAENTSGTSHVHNNAGIFYIFINVANTENYTIIIEQDLDSIPEFPSFLILPLFMMTTLLAVIFYRRKHST